MVSRKNIFLESSHHIETYIGVVVAVLEVQSSVSFELYIDEDFI